MKSEEGEAEKVEKLGEKLRRGVLVGKSRGPCTPTHTHNYHSSSVLSVSARKLAAALWEFNHSFPLFQMHHHRSANNASAAAAGGAGADPRLRRHHHYILHKDRAPDISNFLADASPSSPDQMTPYNPGATPTSSLEFKGRIGDPHYSLKTSTELLKVLNRIWSLEEQHASNISLIKALKSELDHARVRIKELLRDRQADRHEIDDLMKQIAEDKLVRKSKEQDRLHAAVQSVRDELEDERKLRKRSESIHRKLARDLSEVKSSLTSAVKELNQERTRRKLLEDLCDEFARGINEYEREVHTVKHKSDKDWVQGADQDRLILHISESWLDERMQMQLEAGQNGFTDKSIVDKLSLEIETFLKAKQNSRGSENVAVRNRRNSLESVPLNDRVSAPQEVGDDDDSVGSDSNCFELNKPSNKGSKVYEEEPVDKIFKETSKTNQRKKKSIPREGLKHRSPSSLQVKFEEQMAWAMSSDSNKKSQSIDADQGKITDTRPVEGTVSERSEHFEIYENDDSERKNNPAELHNSSKNHIIDNLIRGQLLASEGGNMHAENNYGEASCSNAGWRNQASPVKQWMAKLASQDLDISEASKVPSGSKESNTLKAKLLEARSKGQRSCLKALKGSF
ncbi:uncharacterized protein At5g41620 isoform X2 [Glycine max]|uniref:uncharacterized protein At5g41620 isoform X2 n=1 Tax=Glycine max TaxID=3847 RepID=UPI0007190B9E|nr:uncharacterized protein At5g41620 isoform X2 [Glycine max]|eukprot:XP_014632609.1 uncharacterized protein At5g41620 isoform X2 [Glycine max]